MASGGTVGRSAMSPGIRMPGPGSGGSALFAIIGSDPNVRPGSDAGAHGGPGSPSAGPLTVLAALGAGVMAGRNGAPGACGPLAEACISPRPPPVKPPVAVQLAGGPGGAGREPGVPGDPRSMGGGCARFSPPSPAMASGDPGASSGLRCSCRPRGRAGFDAASAAARAFSRRDRMTRSSTTSSAISTPRPATA